MAFLLFLFWNYRGLKIQVGREELLVAHGFFNRKSFLLKNLVSCKKTKTSFGRYWGSGVRYGSDGSVAYIQLRLEMPLRLRLDRKSICFLF